MLLAVVPTVGASSPNNIKDDATGMPAGRRCTHTSHSHNGQRRRSHSLVLCAGSSTHGAVLTPLLGAEHAPHSQSKLGEDKAMVGGYVWVVSLLSLFYVMQNSKGEQKLGQCSTHGILGIARKLLSSQKQFTDYTEA
jgi:hypothetical protein